MSEMLRVDQESWALAVHFLESDAPEAYKHSLARAIQNAVDSWFVRRGYVQGLQKHYAQILRRHSEEQDAADAWIMLWAMRHPRVCRSNWATGEILDFGVRRQS